MPQAMQSTHASSEPGLFVLAWGLGASAMGLALVTNFRGFADKFADLQRATSLSGRGPSPLMMRLLGIPFVIGGPIGIVVAIIWISHGQVVG